MSDLEPKRLRDGKAFHRDVQEEYLAEPHGSIITEKPITKPSGRQGRIDVHIQVDEQYVAVVEIKNSDWDAMSQQAVRRNARRYARQLWNYIEAELTEGLEVSPGIEFPHLPSSKERLTTIEQIFDEEGIAVVWRDETLDQRKLRAKEENEKASG